MNVGTPKGRDDSRIRSLTFADFEQKLKAVSNAGQHLTIELQADYTSKNPNSYGVSWGPMIKALTFRTSISRQATARAGGLVRPHVWALGKRSSKNNIHKSEFRWRSLSSYSSQVKSIAPSQKIQAQGSLTGPSRPHNPPSWCEIWIDPSLQLCRSASRKAGWFRM